MTYGVSDVIRCSLSRWTVMMSLKICGILGLAGSVSRYGLFVAIWCEPMLWVFSVDASWRCTGWCQNAWLGGPYRKMVLFCDISCMVIDAMSGRSRFRVLVRRKITYGVRCRSRTASILCGWFSSVRRSMICVTVDVCV